MCGFRIPKNLGIFVNFVIFSIKSHHLPSTKQQLYRHYGICVFVAGGRGVVPLRLLDKSWLRTALFSPSSSAIRQTECSIIETMFLVPSRKRDLLDMLSR